MDVGVGLGDRVRVVLIVIPITGLLMVSSLFVEGLSRLLLLSLGVAVIYPLIMISKSVGRRRWGEIVGSFGNCVLYDNGIYINIAKGLDLFIEWRDISRWEAMKDGGSLIVTTDGTEIETPLPYGELEKRLPKNA
ncbi:hypothetical protein [Thermocladium modestius]|nr:hypothetical protein [Thermocladium modestius]